MIAHPGSPMAEADHDATVSGAGSNGSAVRHGRHRNCSNAWCPGPGTEAVPPGRDRCGTTARHSQGSSAAAPGASATLIWTGYPDSGCAGCCSQLCWLHPPTPEVWDWTDLKRGRRIHGEALP